MQEVTSITQFLPRKYVHLNASFEEFPISGVPPSATVERLLEQIPWKIRSHIAEGRETTER